MEILRLVKPPRVYFSCDGPRNSHPKDLSLTEEVKQIVTTGIDWECSVKTLFQTHNLGCRRAVNAAITWFFEHEESGIILEDDCLPSLSFFGYCESLLKRYRDEPTVWHIGGLNCLDSQKQTMNTPSRPTYRFSIYPHVWGWATWADRWARNDQNLQLEFNVEYLSTHLKHPALVEYWHKLHQLMSRNEIDTWDYVWAFTIWAHLGVAIMPEKNLVKNIGFGSDATHTRHQDTLLLGLVPHEIEEINHPKEINLVGADDVQYGERVYLRQSGLNRQIHSILKWLR